MVIKNGKFKIRNATPQDAVLLRNWWNNGKVMAHAGFPKGLGITEREVIESVNKDNRIHKRLIIEYELPND